MPLRAGPPPEFGMGQVGQQAQPQVPGLLQMAQSAMDGGGGQNWMPASIAEQRDRFLAEQAASNPQGDRGGGGGFQGAMPAYYDQANWGPAPVDARGNISNAPTGKFWSQADAMKQQYKMFGGQLPEVMDERPNTFNWHLLGNPAAPAGAPGSVQNPEFGNYMQNGTLISAAKRYYDLHRPISDPATAGSFRPAPQFGPGMFWSTTGELGIPGQLGNYATMWGAGGPGSG